MNKFFGLDVPFLDLVGLHGVRLENGESEIWLDVR